MCNHIRTKHLNRTDWVKTTPLSHVSFCMATQSETWEHIRCKPTSSCKLRKLQYGPSDQHPRGGAQRGGRGDFQKCDYLIQGRVQIVKLSNPPYPLDVDPMTQIEVFIICTERLVTQYAEHSMCRRAVHNTTGNIDICTY